MCSNFIIEKFKKALISIIEEKEKKKQLIITQLFLRHSSLLK